MSQSKKLLEQLSFCVIDLETTGGNHIKDQIIEIGMVHIDHMEVGKSKNFLINPQRDIPDFIQRLTNITDKTVKNAPIIEDVVDEIILFIGDRILVAHNSGFDVPFLNSVLKRVNKEELNNKVICTNIMTKHLIPEMMSSNLGYMSKIFKINHEKAHRAMEDAIATAHLLIRYLKSFEQRNIEKINQLYYPRNRFEIDRIKIDRKSPDALDKIKNIIKDTTTNLLITIKGQQGIFESIIPYDQAKADPSLAYSHLEKLNWEVTTIKQIGPMIDAYFFLNTHFYKLNEDTRLEILNYLSKDHTNPETESLDEIDFLITPHLIQGQFIAYNFLNLTSSSRTIFRYPGHEKKVLQQLKSQLNRFINNQKKQRKVLIENEILKIIAFEVKYLIQNQCASPLSINQIKKDQIDFIKMEKELASSPLLNSRFPLDHI